MTTEKLEVDTKEEKGGEGSPWDQWRKAVVEFVKKEHLALILYPPCQFMMNWVLDFPGSWKFGTFEGKLERFEKVFKALRRDKNMAGIMLRDYDGNSFWYKFAKFPTVRFSHNLMALPWSALIPLQLSVTARKKFPALHRLGGRMFVFSSLSMIFGYFEMERHRLFYSLNKKGELPMVGSTFFRGIMAWFMYTLYKAFTAIKSRKIKEHEIWILRHIASGFWVILGRMVFLPVLVRGKQILNLGDVQSVEAQKMHFDQGHIASIFFCVIGCELYINKFKRRRSKKAKKHRKGEKQLVQAL